MSFSKQLSSAVKKKTQAANMTWKKSVATAFGQVVQMTPVDKGFARRSWLMGNANRGDIGNSVLRPNPSQIPDIGGSVLLYSNIPYIEELEKGSSKQAPRGMVRVVENRWQGIVRANS